MRTTLLPRLRDIFFIAVYLGVLLFAPRMLAVDGDLGRHLALGNFILYSGRVPLTDMFSFTRAGESRPPYEWLTQVGFALANRIAGLDGVILLSAVVIAAAFTFVYADSAKRNAMPVAALAAASLACAASSLHLLPRPHIFTFLFLAIWIERLERVRRADKVRLWHFPLLMLIWANAHGGFVFGFLAWLAYTGGWIWETLRKNPPLQNGKTWLVIGVTSMAASFITPSGGGNWKAVLSNNSTYILSRTVETMPPDLSQMGTWPFVLLLTIAFVLFLGIHRKQNHSHILLLGGFALLALLMARNIPLFAIVASPVVSEKISHVLSRYGKWGAIEENIASIDKSMHGAVWPIAVAGGIAFLVLARYQVRKEAVVDFDARVLSVGAADWLIENPQSGNLFNDINWGGYLLYRLWPEQRVFVDSQTDFYGEAFIRQYEIALNADPGWEEIISFYEIEWAILQSGAELALNLSQDEAWEILYSDQTAVILRTK